MSALWAGSLVLVVATWRPCYSSPEANLQKMCSLCQPTTPLVPMYNSVQDGSLQPRPSFSLELISSKLG